MGSADGVWLEVRVDGVVRWRFPAEQLDSAAAAADALLDRSRTTVEIVRCSGEGATVETVMLLRYAAPPEAG
jgi:hypothetical protein